MRLVAPPDCSACSVDGVEYVVRDGHVELPDDAGWPALLSHGFTTPAAPAVHGDPLSDSAPLPDEADRQAAEDPTEGRRKRR